MYGLPAVMRRRPVPSLVLLYGAAVASGCGEPSTAPGTRPLTVYCSVDESFARDLFRRYTERTGTTVAPVFDSEAGKTTGLVSKIIAEAQSGRPRADVFWSGELFNTIVLARQGLLEPYDAPSAADIPPRFRDSERRWTAFAVRPRVLAFHPDRIRREDVPTSWEALAEPRHAARLAFANPLFGTTRGHVAAMFARWGPERGRAFLTGLRDGGAIIADGNSAAVRMIADGRATFAATDLDDVWVAQRAGVTLDCVYPDMGDGGTLLVPCSVAIVQGTSRLEAARQLVDFLVSAEAERLLARSDSRNIPVRASVRDELRVAWPAESRVEFEAISDAIPEAVSAVREILLR